MNAELSRRVAKVMHTRVIIQLEPEARLNFVEAVEAADSFDALPENIKTMILQAERSKTARFSFKQTE